MDSTPQQYDDIDDVESTDEAEVRVVDARSGRPKAHATVIIAGPEHPQRRAFEFEIARKLRRELAEKGRIEPGEPADDDKRQTDHLVACTLGWRGLRIGGTAFEFTPDHARQLYTDPRRRWLRDQVRAALDQRDLFIRSSVRG